MNIYGSNIEEEYKDTIIGNLGNSGTADLLLHILQYWSACAVDEENQAVPMVMYCSHMMYKYYSFIGFSPIIHNGEEKTIQNELFNNIPHFIKNRLRVDCIQDGFVMYNYKLMLRKIEVIPPIPDSMIPVDFCQNFIH